MNKINFLAFIFVLVSFHRLVNGVLRTDFFPYGPTNGDQTMVPSDDNSEGPYPIPVNFLFFNNVYSNAFVGSNGVISLGRSLSGNSDPFPVIGLTCVAPFYADVDTNVGGNIYYRPISDATTLTAVSNELRNNLPYFNSFSATWAFVATFIEVAPNGGVSTMKNTFQGIILTDGLFSFAIFNYETLMWKDLTRTNAGFNAGDGTNYYVLADSSTDAILEVANMSNVNVQGKWIFRIDLPTIVDASIYTTSTTTTTTTTINTIITTKKVDSTDYTLYIAIGAGVGGGLLLITTIAVITIVIVTLKKETLFKTKVVPFSAE